MRICILLLLSLLVINTGFGQEKTLEELKAEVDKKKGELSAIQAEIDGLQSQIKTYPGWKFGAFGTIGASLSGFNSWLARDQPNVNAGNIGISANGLANLDQEKFFWRNGGNINLGWVKFDNEDDPNDSDDFEQATDVFNISSLYGRKLNDKWAVSGLGEYRTTLLSNFNDPGYLDLGVGATWTPITALTVVFHPLNYNFVFADDGDVFQSSLGCKVLADYTRSLPMGISWKSNLSAFLSYEELDHLSNWTWINSFGYTIWNGIGLGFEVGLRGNKQEALNYEKNVRGIETATFDNVDNELQTYWLLGLNYNF